MQFIRNLLLGSAFLALAAGIGPSFAAAAPVQIAQASACNVNLTGTVTQVFSSGEFAMRVDNHHIGSIHVRDASAHINTRGLALQAGTYAGVNGCYGPGQRYFVD